MEKPNTTRIATISLRANPENPFTLEGYSYFESNDTWISFQWVNDEGIMYKDISIPIGRIEIIIQELETEASSDGN